MWKISLINNLIVYWWLGVGGVGGYIILAMVGVVRIV